MKKREAWNLVAHFFGALVLVSLVLWNPWFLLLDVIVWATLREQAQHRIKLIDTETTIGYEKRTFWDWSWLKWHHAWEIGQWALGALAALVPYEIFVA